MSPYVIPSIIVKPKVQHFHIVAWLRGFLDAMIENYYGNKFDITRLLCQVNEAINKLVSSEDNDSKSAIPEEVKQISPALKARLDYQLKMVSSSEDKIVYFEKNFSGLPWVHSSLSLIDLYYLHGYNEGSARSASFQEKIEDFILALTQENSTKQENPPPIKKTKFDNSDPRQLGYRSWDEMAFYEAYNGDPELWEGDW